VAAEKAAASAAAASLGEKSAASGAMRNVAERKEWTTSDDILIRESVHTHGFKWRVIAALLPGLVARPLDPQAIAPGMRFATFVPSVFMVAHRDYVRTVSVRPIDVAHTEVSIEWLVHPDADPAAIDMAHLTDVGRTVVLEDARVSEFAQRGMAARPDGAGVLMPQEYDVRAFQQWWPLVYADLHEMGGNSSYYFPPPAQPVNREITATQREWLVGGLDPTLKSARLANYLLTLRKEMLSLGQACGEAHPALVSLDRFDILDGLKATPAREVFGYEAGWGLPSDPDRDATRALMPV
jgi:hypothetical protein